MSSVRWTIDFGNVRCVQDQSVPRTDACHSSASHVHIMVRRKYDFNKFYFLVHERFCVARHHACPFSTVH